MEITASGPPILSDHIDDRSQSPSLRQFTRGFLATTWLTSVRDVCLRIAGYDNKAFLDQCAESEKNGKAILGFIATLNVVLLMSVGIVGTNYALGTGSSASVTFAVIFLALFTALVDHYALLRSTIFPDGMKLLRQGGFRSKVTVGSDWLSRVAKGLRVLITFSIGALVAIIIALALNRSAVDRRIDERWLQNNAFVVAQATRQFAEARARLSTNYESKQRIFSSLSAQVEQFLASEASAALKAQKRRRPDRMAEVTRKDLGERERRLATMSGELAALREELNKLDSTRNDVMRRAIMEAPEQIPRDDSFIARVTALFDEIHDRPTAIIPAAMLDALLIGLDLAVITLKGISVPSKYSMLEARRGLAEMVEQARLADGETEPPAGDDPGAPEPEDDPPPLAPGNHSDEPEGEGEELPLVALAKMNGATPPRRRGRPRTRFPGNSGPGSAS